MKNDTNITLRIMIAFALGAVLLTKPLSAGEKNLLVDFRDRPSWWATSICLPDDPQKTLVSSGGQLLYDFGGSYFPYAGGRGFRTTVAIVVTEDSHRVRQTLADPRVPIVRTTEQAPGLEITQEAFATIVERPRGKASDAKPAVRVQRVDDGEVLLGWAQPKGTIHPELANIAVHMQGSVAYDLLVEPGSRYRVALGLCEGYHDQPKQRVLDLKLEGADPQTVDLVAEVGHNRAGLYVFDAEDVNRDGQITLRVDANSAGWDVNTILNAFWVFPSATAIDSAKVLAGAVDAQSIVAVYPARMQSNPRMDMILVHVKNSSKVTRTIHPRIIVKSQRPLNVDLDEQRVTVNGSDTLAVSQQMIKVQQPFAEKRIVHLAPMTLGPGEETNLSLAYAVHQTVRDKQTETAQVIKARDRAIAYWKNGPLPFGRVRVPDPQVQALIDSAIRNIWQARDIKQGVPVFQVGPTCYRGLWIVDGAFLLEAATLLGAGEEARNGIEYTLKQQKENGAFEVLSKSYFKENGIILWTCVRHAQLTQDKKWLESVWPQLQKAIAYIEELRKRSLTNDEPLDDGLIPPGDIDGGLGGHDRAEFTNVYWNLLGLKAAIHAARWLGKTDEADQWQVVYDDFLATFRRAAERDMKTDSQGNAYLPILMGDRDHELPQRAQWAFCHAVYPGQLFPARDPLVTGNLAMLAATEQEGMVVGTGWDATGIWNYFASFYGHAWLWNGRGRKAAECLYAMANHASPLLAWREEQNTRDMPQRFVGDMPHNWASAEFIRLAVHLIALDRGDQLHLLEGLPREWTRAGMVTELKGVATPFGPLTLRLQVAKDGQTAELQVAPLKDPSCRKIVVHLGGWASTDKSLTCELDPLKPHTMSIPLGDVGNARRRVATALRQSTQRMQECFSGSATTKVKPAFVPLPPGAVRPTGWLRDWAAEAANGITGHLDERTPVYQYGYKGVDFKAIGVQPHGVGWPIEQSAYWLDGLVRLAYILDDPALIKKVQARLDPVVDGVLEGGESLVYWRPKNILKSAFNNWAHSHIGRALVAYYEATGDQRILAALVKVYRDYPLPEFSDRFAPVNGMVNLDPMLDTYALSGDKAVLDNALASIDRPSFQQVIDRWNRGELVAGHGVIFYENIRVPALMYPWTGRQELLDATLKTIAWSDRLFGLPMGLVSSEEYLAGIGSTRNVETCNVAAGPWTFGWLLRITGQRDYADRMEQVFFNAGPAPVARDYQTMSYYQCANRFSLALPDENDHPKAPGAGCYRFSELGHRVLCCVGNLNRVVPNYIQHMWMATLDHGLAATLYGPCNVQGLVADGVPVSIEQRTEYPFADTIDLTIRPDRATRFPLYLRVPQWCDKPVIKLNGKTVQSAIDPRGFVKLLRDWSPGDRVTLKLPMTVRLLRGRETSYPEIPYFQRNRKLASVKAIANPYASLYRGPLLFALPIADIDPNQPAPDAKWNYALDIDPAQLASQTEVIIKEMPKTWHWQLSAPPVQLRVPARQFDWRPTELQPLPKEPVTDGRATTMTLVPYGCTRFRVSMFPVTERTSIPGGK